MPLIVTGSIGIDTVETPHDKVERVPGGSCVYFAAAASHIAPGVRVVGAVGGDWPDDHRRTLESFRGIDLTGLETRPEGETFAWGGRYFGDLNERETIFTELGVLGEHPAPIPDGYRDSEFVFLANAHPTTQLDMLRQIPDRKLAVADSMDLWMNIAHDELLELLKEIDGFVINDAEGELLTGERHPIIAARRILEMGPSFVVIKKGVHGAIMVHHNHVATLPAFPAESVVDPTGAGDSFAGGMMAYLAATGRTDEEAIQTALAWGTVTASFTIESFGLDRLAEIDRSDLDARMMRFQAAARVGETVVGP